MTDLRCRLLALLANSLRCDDSVCNRRYVCRRVTHPAGELVTLLCRGGSGSGHKPGGRSVKKITVPVLVMHSEDDQIVPYVAAGPLSAKLLKNGTLKTYKGFPHGMPTTEAETINADLLAFLKS